MVSALILISIFSVTGKLLTIVLFVLSKNLRNKSLFLVINMAFADPMLGTLSLPSYIFIHGSYYHLWTEASIDFASVQRIIDTVFLQVALISAIFISAERFYAVYWPFKHRTLTMQTHRIVVGMVRALAVLISAVFNALFNLISFKHSVYIWTPYIYFDSDTCNVWLSYLHLEKVSTRTGRFATGKQSLAKQTPNKVFDVCIYSCCAVL